MTTPPSDKRITETEEIALQALLIVREYHTGGRRIGNIEFMELMNVIRVAIIELENKKFGCPKGQYGRPSYNNKAHANLQNGGRITPGSGGHGKQ